MSKYPFVILLCILLAMACQQSESESDNTDVPDTVSNIDSRNTSKSNALCNDTLDYSNITQGTHPDSLFQDDFVYDFLNAIGLIDPGDVLDPIIVSTGFNAIEFTNGEPANDSVFVVRLMDPLIKVPESEKSFFEAQVNVGKGEKWDLKRLNALKNHIRYTRQFKYRESFSWEVFHACGFENLVSIAIPLFTKDRKAALLYVESTSGPLAGSGTWIRYDFQDGKWVWIDDGIIWIS